MGIAPALCITYSLSVDLSRATDISFLLKHSADTVVVIRRLCLVRYPIYATRARAYAERPVGISRKSQGR